jgi:hypothetical protein
MLEAATYGNIGFYRLLHSHIPISGEAVRISQKDFVIYIPLAAPLLIKKGYWYKIQ